MGLLSRIQQFLTDINHLGVGDEQDIALPHYDPGTLHGRQVRQTMPLIDCTTGNFTDTSIDILDPSLRQRGLSTLTGCVPKDGLDGLTGGYLDGYRFISSDMSRVTVEPCYVPIFFNINNTVTLICSSQLTAGYSERVMSEGFPNGTCHPDNVKKKLNEFACMERERCYSVPPPNGTCTDDLPTASPTGTDYQATNYQTTNLTNTSTPRKTVDKADFISSNDAPSNLGYLGFLVAPIGLGIVAASLGVYAAYRWWTGSEKSEPNEPAEIPMSEIQIERDTDIPPEEITLPKHKAYNPYAQ